MGPGTRVELAFLPYQRSVLPLYDPGFSCVPLLSAIPQIQAAEVRSQAVAIGAQKSKIIGSVVFGIPVLMIGLQGNFSCFGITLFPPALPALLAFPLA